MLSGPGDGISAEASARPAAGARTGVPAVAVSLKGSNAKALAAIDSSANKRVAKKLLDKEIAGQQAHDARNATLNKISGLAEHATSFEDMWHTTDFQLRMLTLCKDLYGNLGARQKFNILNDVRNDLTAEGKMALKKVCLQC